jgi:hypothetical protein
MGLPFTLNHRQIACDFFISKGREDRTAVEVTVPGGIKEVSGMRGNWR